MRKALPAVLVLLSLLAVATAPAPAAAAPDDGLAPNGVLIHIDIEGDGDARWTISTSYVLNNSSERRAFDRVAADFERGGGTTGFSIQPFEQVVPQVAERTGREMAIRDPAWRGVVENESGTRRGYLRLSFTWTNFARVTNESVTLDGAFQGGWFGDLTPDQTLVISPPSGYDVSSAQPSHETVNGTLRWTGPVEFGSSEPVARFDRQPIPPEMPWASITGAILTALVIGGIIAYAWFWRSRQASEPPAPPAEDGDGPGDPADPTPGATTNGGTDGAELVDAGAGETAGGGADAGERSGADADHSAGVGSGTGTENGAGFGSSTGTGVGVGSDAGAGPGVEAPGATGGTDTEPDTEPELLSDEERVERLLEKHGGRMKQAKIVEETRWSNAKVSQLLSQMADADRVEKLRIGRENLISIPEDDAGDDTGR